MLLQTWVATEEWGFPPPTAAILTEGDLFLSGGTTLKGFGKAAGIPTATWASGGNLNTARYRYGGSWNYCNSIMLLVDIVLVLNDYFANTETI